VNEAFVGLGSNLGDRLANLATAIGLLAREPGFTLREVSLAYESEPIGPPQPRYLNAVAQIGTLLSPRATLQRLQAIEEGMGRVRRERWGSREIDLDLLLYGGRWWKRPDSRSPIRYSRPARSPWCRWPRSPRRCAPTFFAHRPPAAGSAPRRSAGRRSALPPDPSPAP